MGKLNVRNDITPEMCAAAFAEHGNAVAAGRALGCDPMTVTRKMRKVGQPTFIAEHMFPQREDVEIGDGHAIVFSDCHWWPGEAKTTAHEALLVLIEKLKPHVLIGNGDLLDMAGISRHPPLGWQGAPPVVAELETAKAHLGELRARARKARADVVTLRTRGNHDDGRFDARLAAVAPEFKDLQGLRLRDHLQDWPVFLSVVINGHTIVKHRWHGGLSASWSNAVKSGQNFVTGHLHRLTVSPFDDVSGPNVTSRRRWGVDTGTLADPEHPAFEYTEANPRAWRQGFVVLTFNDGRLLPPETVEVHHGQAWFRGQSI